MKLKNVLLSGLFLSTAFVACTNDDFTEISTPVNNNGAIALGENFTINVDKADALTRAVFNDKFAPTWEKTDVLGAAWVHQVTDFDEETNEVIACGTIGSTYGNLYSNHPFELTEGAGTGSAKFQTVTNAFAGAYALYFPYDPSVSKTMASIPVKMKTYELDCKEPLKNVSENMFSYAPVAFVPGGNQTGKFELGQVPVLVRMSFTPDKKLNMNLADGITIKNIVIIAKKGENTVLASEGKIATDKAPGKDNYNGTDNKDLSEIIAYSTVKTTESLFITAKNSDNEDYKLIKEDVATKKEFIFSILPFTDKADQVIVKVVTDKGVFASTIKGGVSDAITAKLKMFENAAKEGGQVRVNIPLDVTDNDKVIYTVEAFKEAWKDACDGKITEPLMLGTTLELTEALVCDKAATVTVTGGKLVVPSMNLNYGKNIVFNSELEVKGKLYTSGASVFTADKLTAKDVEIQGEATIKAAEIEKLTVAATATVDLSAAGNAGKVKTIQVENGGRDGVVKGTLKLNKEHLEIGTLNSNGILDLTLTEDYVNEGTMTMGEMSIDGGYKFINKGTLTLNGAFDGELENAAGATLYINADSEDMILTNKPADAVNGKAAGIVNIKLGVTLTAGAAAAVTNEGVMNISGSLVEAADGGVVGGTNAYFNLNGHKTGATVDGGILTFNSSNSAVLDGTIVKMNDNAKVENGASAGENIALIITNKDKLTASDAAGTSDAAVDLTGVETLIVNGNYTVNSERATELAKVNLQLNKGTVTLEADLTMGTSTKVIVADVVKVTTKANTTDVKALTLVGEDNEVLAGASLTIAGYAKLAGSSNAVLKMHGNSVTTEGTNAAIDRTNLTTVIE